MNETKIKHAYKQSKKIYDDVLTQNSWFSKLYINVFWGVNDWEIANNVLAYIPDNFSGKLLDIPVGTGVFTVAKYAQLPLAKICCIDYSQEMLNQAKAKFNKANLENVECMQGDVGKLPFNSESFDIVLSMNGFHAFPDKARAYDEAARVLKKGGEFVGCFYIKRECRRTDFVVNHILSKKGWFTPPFHTKSELKEILKNRFTSVDLYSNKAMVWFKCVK